MDNVLRLFEFLTGSGVVAVSGGADSVALFRVLKQLKRPLLVAHVNYQLRSAESDADEEFVRDLARQQGSTFESTRITIPPNENLEASARQRRYGWFQKLAVKHGAGWIATGHTRDDQAETVLHRIIRGTGLRGLGGIRLVHHDDSAIPVVRPLLERTRADILTHLLSLDQPFRHDTSNDDRRFTRNRLRQEVLPLLNAISPCASEHLAQLARLADDTHGLLAHFVEKQLRDVELPRAGETLVFDRILLQQTHPHLLPELLRRVWQREGWPEKDMTFDHWQRLALLTEGDYPGGIRLVHAPPVVRLEPR